MNRKAIVLAAGKGTRLNSQHDMIPKAMREVGDKPLIRHVTDSLSFLDPKDIVVVVGFMGEAIQEYLGPAYTYAWQTEQKGTAHAVLCAREALGDFDGTVLVCFGDMPLLRRATYEAVLEKQESSGAAATVLTTVKDPPLAYGRIVRSADGSICDIVEQKECTPEQLKITELNVGVNAYPSRLMFEGLQKIKPAGVSGEYYLTALPPMLCAQGKTVESVQVSADEEIYGVNTPDDLEFARKVLANRIKGE
ncbi:MAG: NTP transferase domain-containing protein [Eubacteriales bacterium]|nr:NTP transferase domain-containing protein [Eubacteriales bacterium]